MKAKLGLFLFLFQISLIAMAATPNKEFKFKYTYNGQRLELIDNSSSWEESFEKSSMKCFKHFTAGQSVSENTGMKIIDICANPRS